MGQVERVTISIPAEMAAAVRSVVDGGEYASTSEVVREALRDWSRKRGAENQALDLLREAIRLGDESGPSLTSDEVIANVRRRLAVR